MEQCARINFYIADHARGCSIMDPASFLQYLAVIKIKVFIRNAMKRS
jgi:hypothetical protein